MHTPMTLSVTDFLTRAKAVAEAQGRTISGFSHVLFDDGRTLPAMERGELGLSVGRLLRADKILRELERQAIRKGSR